MNLGEMKNRIKSQARLNTPELDDLILDDINAAYLQLSRRADWSGLRVEDNVIPTVANQVSYPLPYPFDRFIKDSIRYNYVAGNQSGTIIPLVGNDKAQLYRQYAVSLSDPLVASVTGGAGGPGYFIGATTVANTQIVSGGVGGGIVTGVSDTLGFVPSWNSTMQGQWMVFGSDSNGNDGKDYGYQIETVVNPTKILLLNYYRGPSLTASSYQIVPSGTLNLRFDPAFTNSGVNITYGYMRKPRRLYNEFEIPEVPELCEAIVWKTLADNAIYHDKADQAVFMLNARTALRDAMTPYLSNA